MSQELTRILLRYLAMLLVAKGVFSPELGNTIVADPDVLAVFQISIGIATSAAVEIWWLVARKFGWAK
jgi:hypothetical protein